MLFLVLSMEEDSRPLCFGTYVGESDILCSRCCPQTKKECIKFIEGKD
jgi:hypothetical protein